MDTSFTAKKEWEIASQELTFTDKLGEGASAKVYKAKYKGEVVAVKIIKTDPDEAGGPKVDLKKLVRDFTQECEIMSKISAPHVLKFYGALTSPKVCIVMEYCSKGSLFHLLSEDSGFELGWKQVFRWTKEMVLGINALHNCNPPVYHRDLKSLNLLLDSEMKIRVCDFGLARLSEGDVATLARMRGTYAYCAPELYKASSYTKYSDVYSMAIILWEMAVRCLTGKYLRPYQEFDKIKLGYTIIVKAAKENLRPTLPEGLPAEVKSLIQQMWTAVPEERPLCDDILKRIDEMEKLYTAVTGGKELARNMSFRFALTREDVSDLGGFGDKAQVS